MKYVQNGNKQLRVADDRVEDFLARGYQEIDATTGKPIKKKATDEMAALKRENKALREQLAKLQADQ